MAIQFSKEEQEELKNNKSEIYQMRNEETRKQDVKNLSPKGKWEYYKDYYLKYTVVGIVVVILLAVCLIQAFTKKPSSAVYIAIREDAIDEYVAEAFKLSLQEYLKLDEESEIVIIDTACSDQQLQTYLYAGTVDIVITGDEDFKRWGEGEYFLDVETDEEVAFYRDYGDNLMFHTKYITGQDVLDNKKTAKTEVGKDKTEYHCGLYLTESEKYKQISGGLKTPVMGISQSTDHFSDVKKVVRYLMDNQQKMELDMNKAKKNLSE